MDAMHRLYELTEEEGQQLYGENFHNASYYTALHFFNAGWRDADHIHEGNGFLSQHFKLTNMFEEAIQAVDSSVYIPYWDFTIDTSEGLSIYESPMFTPETFGTIMKPYNDSMCWQYKYDNLEDARIPDGRWANLKVEMNTKYPDLRQGISYL
jgi:hypothetical protein